MKVKLIILLLTCLTFVFFNISCKNQSKQIQEVRDSVVSIKTRYKSTKKIKDHLGTGFFIGKNIIATAYHVSKEFEKEKSSFGESYQDIVEIVISKQSSVETETFVIPIELIKYDAINDLAVYTFDISNLETQWKGFKIKPLVISDELPNIGEEVFLTGYFSGYTYPFSSIGTVSSITENNFKPSDDVTFNQAILCNLTSIPGHSGGPVVSLESYKVIGLNTRALNPSDVRVPISLSPNSTHLLKLIKELNSTQEKK